MMRTCLLACLAGVSLALSALTATSGPPDNLVEASLIPGWRMADGRHVAALRLQLEPGWKTYWRAPGDIGIPPEFDWRASGNLAGAEITWPTPHRFDQGGVTTIGYENEVILPLTLMPVQAGQDIVLRGTLQMGVCSDICVPVHLSVAVDLPRGVTRPDPRIVAAMAARPFTAQEAGAGELHCTLSPGKNGGLRLRTEVSLPGTGPQEMAVFETDNPQVWVAPATLHRAGDRLIAETDLVHVDGRAFAVDRSGLRLTVLSATQAVDFQGCATD